MFDPMALPKVIFITNFCAHYRVRTFEVLARRLPTRFYFYSAGREWYWQHGTRQGNFEFEYLPGVTIGRTRITPSLAGKLLRHDCDVFIKCVDGKFALLLTYLIARLRGKPFILWTGLWHDLQTPIHRLLAPFTHYLYRHADAIAAYGEHVKRYLIEKGVEAERIFPTHHAVDNELHSRLVPPLQVTELRVQLGIAPDSPVVLYLGRLVDGKGLDYLVDAFADLRHPEAVLVIVGEGDQKAMLQERVRRLGIADRVRFCPYVPPEQTPLWYALAFTAVLPSVTTRNFREPWGLTVNEAMNQGVPVIASDAVGAAAGGLVRDGINGLVVPERDRAALAAALQRILTEPGLRDRLSEAARQIIETWDNERMVQDFCAAVQYAMKTRRQSAVQSTFRRELQ